MFGVDGWRMRCAYLSCLFLRFFGGTLHVRLLCFDLFTFRGSSFSFLTVRLFLRRDFFVLCSRLHVRSFYQQHHHQLSSSPHSSSLHLHITFNHYIRTHAHLCLRLHVSRSPLSFLRSIIITFLSISICIGCFLSERHRYMLCVF